MKRIVEIGGKGKVKKAEAVAIKRLQEYGALALDAKAAIIQELIPSGLMHILEVIEEEVVSLSGDRYRRNGKSSYDRWGKQQGAVHIKDHLAKRLVSCNNHSSLERYGAFDKLVIVGVRASTAFIVGVFVVKIRLNPLDGIP